MRSTYTSLALLFSKKVIVSQNTLSVHEVRGTGWLTSRVAKISFAGIAEAQVKAIAADRRVTMERRILCDGRVGVDMK